MIIRIKEEKPNTDEAIAATLKWVGSFAKVTNKKELWNGLVPQINQSIKHEFSNANPNRWERLKATTRAQKKKYGYPVTIGVRTKGLKQALTEFAIIKKKRKRLEWIIGNISNTDGKPVRKYASWFDRKRPVFKATRRFLKKVYRKTVGEWIKSNIGSREV